jgi:IS5 family transposase
LIASQELTRVIVDSTVQHKAIAHPTDSRLLETARSKLVQAAKDAGIALKQTFAKEGKVLSHKASRYAHARQFKRMRSSIKRQSTIVARLGREIARKASAITTIGAAVQQALADSLGKGVRLVAQSGQRKATGGQPKLYAWHAPEVGCISKGKAKTPYEFGVKVGIASTLRGNLIVGARAFHGNPYDGHTLHEQLEQASILMEDRHIKPTSAFVDLGYRGVDADNPSVRIIHRGKFKRISEQERGQLKRRQAIEPIIGHLKSDHRMGRCYLKGQLGDSMNAVLAAAGYNIRWLLRQIVKKGLTFLEQFFCACKKWGCRQPQHASICCKRSNHG